MHATLIPSALDSSLIILELRHRRRETALAEMVERAAEAAAIRSPGAVLDLLAAREAMVGAAFGREVALEAARSLAISEARVVLGRSRRGIAWDAPDLLPVRLIALLLSPAERPLAIHLAAFTRIAGVLKQPRSRSRLLEAESSEEFSSLVREALA